MQQRESSNKECNAFVLFHKGAFERNFLRGHCTVDSFEDIGFLRGHWRFDSFGENGFGVTETFGENIIPYFAINKNKLLSQLSQETLFGLIFSTFLV